MKSYENDRKGLSYIKYPNLGLDAFLDISGSRALNKSLSYSFKKIYSVVLMLFTFYFSFLKLVFSQTVQNVSFQGFVSRDQCLWFNPANQLLQNLTRAGNILG